MRLSARSRARRPPEALRWDETGSTLCRALTRSRATVAVVAVVVVVAESEREHRHQPRDGHLLAPLSPPPLHLLTCRPQIPLLCRRPSLRRRRRLARVLPSTSVSSPFRSAVDDRAVAAVSPRRFALRVAERGRPATLPSGARRAATRIIVRGERGSPVPPVVDDSSSAEREPAAHQPSPSPERPALPPQNQTIAPVAPLAPRRRGGRGSRRGLVADAFAANQIPVGTPHGPRASLEQGAPGAATATATAARDDRWAAPTGPALSPAAAAAEVDGPRFAVPSGPRGGRFVDLSSCSTRACADLLSTSSVTVRLTSLPPPQPPRRSTATHPPPPHRRRPLLRPPSQRPPRLALLAARSPPPTTSTPRSTRTPLRALPRPPSPPPRPTAAARGRSRSVPSAPARASARPRSSSSRGWRASPRRVGLLRRRRWQRLRPLLSRTTGSRRPAAVLPWVRGTGLRLAVDGVDAEVEEVLPPLRRSAVRTRPLSARQVAGGATVRASRRRGSSGRSARPRSVTRRARRPSASRSSVTRRTRSGRGCARKRTRCSGRSASASRRKRRTRARGSVARVRTARGLPQEGVARPHRSASAWTGAAVCRPRRAGAARRRLPAGATTRRPR